MAYRAKLDADRIFWGVEEVETLAEGDIEVPQECDLKPGHYRWNPEPVGPKGEKQPPRFDPLDKSLRRDSPTQLLADRALYELLWDMHNKTGVPQYCAEWAVQYEASVDADLGKLFGKRFAKALGKE